mgnify:CR=1 FL=1
MAGRKNGLGRGLDAFFPDRTSVVKEPARKTITKTVKTEKKSDVAEKQTNPTVAKKQTADSKTGAMIVKISSVEPNMDQPRKQFDEDALMELSESIKQYGVLHPLLVSDKKDYYEIIAGERRWRAAKLAYFRDDPCGKVSGRHLPGTDRGCSTHTAGEAQTILKKKKAGNVRCCRTADRSFGRGSTARRREKRNCNYKGGGIIC